MLQSWFVVSLIFTRLGVAACSSHETNETPYVPEPLPNPESFRAGVARLGVGRGVHAKMPSRAAGGWLREGLLRAPPESQLPAQPQPSTDETILRPPRCCPSHCGLPRNPLPPQRQPPPPFLRSSVLHVLSPTALGAHPEVTRPPGPRRRPGPLAPWMNVSELRARAQGERPGKRSLPGTPTSS
jgi:hypothetical protein